MNRTQLIANLADKYANKALSAAMVNDMVKEGYITEQERDIILGSKDKDKP